MSTLKKVSVFILIIGYIAAGINHFRIPAFYTGIIPAYLPYHPLLNIAAGTCEILLGLLLIFPQTRKIAAWGIVFMLIAFLPVHIGMLAGHTKAGEVTVTPVLAWARLFFQPVLIVWAWWHTKRNENEL